MTLNNYSYHKFITFTETKEFYANIFEMKLEKLKDKNEPSSNNVKSLFIFLRNLFSASLSHKRLIPPFQFPSPLLWPPSSSLSPCLLAFSYHRAYLFSTFSSHRAFPSQSPSPSISVQILFPVERERVWQWFSGWWGWIEEEGVSYEWWR
ncbi:hypothetical protein Droror1_Dr00025461 [Drosera rotundifolia]